MKNNSFVNTPTLPHIVKTKQMQEVEQRFGQDIRLVLVNLFNQHGTQAAVAEQLGVTQPTIANWFSDLGIQTERKPLAFITTPA